MWFKNQTNLTDLSIDLFSFIFGFVAVLIGTISLIYLRQFRRYMPVLAFLKTWAFLVSSLGFKQLFVSVCLWFCFIIAIVSLSTKNWNAGQFWIFANLVGQFWIFWKVAGYFWIYWKLCGYFWIFLKLIRQFWIYIK